MGHIDMVNVINGMWSWLYKIAEREPEPPGMVRPAKVFLQFSIICAFVTLIPGVLLPKTGVYGILACICWICFVFFGLYIWSWFCCVVVYDQKGFGCKSLFGKQDRYFYGDITGISVRDRNITLYIGKDQVVIDLHDKGKDTFLHTVDVWYGYCHEGQPVPSVTDKEDILKGNVKSPVAYFVGRLLILVFFLGLFLYVYFLNMPFEESDLTYKSIEVASSQMEQGQLRLYTAEDPMFYRIRDGKKLLDTEQIDYLLTSSNLVLEVGFVTKRAADPPFYEVAVLKAGSADISISLNETNRLRREDGEDGLMVIAAVAVALLGYLLMALYVGCNADKCSKRLFYFFFPGEKHSSEEDVPEMQVEDRLR